MNKRTLIRARTSFACSAFFAALVSCGGQPQTDGFCVSLVGTTYRSTHYQSVMPLLPGLKHQQLIFGDTYFTFPGADHSPLYGYTCEGDTVITSNNMEFAFSDDMSELRMSRSDQAETELFRRVPETTGGATNCLATEGKIYVLPEVAEDSDLTLNNPTLPFLNFGSGEVTGRLPWEVGIDIIDGGVYDCLMGEFHVHRSETDTNPIIVSSDDGFESIIVTYAEESFELVPASVLSEPVWKGCRPLAPQFVQPTPPPGSAPVPTPSWTPVIPVPNPVYDDQTGKISILHTEMASSLARDVELAVVDEIRRDPSVAGSPTHLFQIQPAEFLYGERFSPVSTVPLDSFNIAMGLVRSRRTASGTDDRYQLGINVSTEKLESDVRPNAVITYLVHAPGRMTTPYYRMSSEQQPAFESILSIVQKAMFSSLESLKEGDVLNLITVNENAEISVNGWHFNEGDCAFVTAVGDMGHFPPRRNIGSLADGLSLAYDVASAAYEPDKINQLIMITPTVDADSLDPDLITNHAGTNGREGIRFSTLNVSRFASRDEVEKLIALTELGAGSYSSLLSPHDARRIMTDGFGRFFAPAATDSAITLSFPQTLSYDSPVAVSDSILQTSTARFSKGASQIFLANFSGSITLEGSFQLTINYTDPTGTKRTASVQATVAELFDQNQNMLEAANLVVGFADISSGRMSCAEFLESGLASESFDDEIARKYLEAINTRCALKVKTD